VSHTPGPHKADGNYILAGEPPHRFYIGKAFDSSTPGAEPTPDTAEANARLWAAAPDYADACALALAYLTDDDARSDMGDTGMARYDDVVDALRAARDKARGQ
jgi:hypothetical protein